MNCVIHLSLLMLLPAGPVPGQTPKERSTSCQEDLDKIYGGWVGKAIGLMMGVPKEYSEPWPPSDFDYYAQVPKHFSERVSGDDIYLPLVNQLALQKFGINATPEQYMQEWAARLLSGRVWVSARTLTMASLETKQGRCNPT